MFDGPAERQKGGVLMKAGEKTLLPQPFSYLLKHGRGAKWSDLTKSVRNWTDFQNRIDVFDRATEDVWLRGCRRGGIDGEMSIGVHLGEKKLKFNQMRRLISLIGLAAWRRGFARNDEPLR